MHILKTERPVSLGQVLAQPKFENWSDSMGPLNTAILPQLLSGKIFVTLIKFWVECYTCLKISSPLLQAAAQHGQDDVRRGERHHLPGQHLPGPLSPLSRLRPLHKGRAGGLPGTRLAD